MWWENVSLVYLAGSAKKFRDRCGQWLKPTQVYHKAALVRAKQYSRVLIGRNGNLPPFLL